MIPRVVLKPGKEKAILARHPWVFSGAILRADSVVDGDTVDVWDSSSHWLARGYYNSRSQIVVRLWTWNDEPIDRVFLRSRLEQAILARDAMIDARLTNACRLVNAESDLLPGLTIDRYANHVVVQFLTLGVERRKQELVELIQELTQADSVYERSDVDVREKEGLKPAVGVLCGRTPTEPVEIRENSLHFRADVRNGHKTGFYLDQRENRRRVGEMFRPVAGPTPEGEVLNAFSYTGGFSVYACLANVNLRAVNLDSSREAQSLAQENMRLNGCLERGEFVEGDAFQILRRYRDMGRTFNAIILDPPKFVHSLSQVQSGLRGYKDINLLAFKLLKPGGLLFTFSCSGQVSPELFQKVVFEAALDAKREAQIIGKLQQSPDHPILLSFPESEYLKGLVCRVA